MIAETIERTNQTLEERGIPAESFFKAIFEDGSEITEKEANWSTFSEPIEVEYFGTRKVLRVATLPVARMEASHEGLETAIDVPEGCRAYQAIRGETLIIPNLKREDRVIGRVIGIIRDGMVIEERFLDGQQYTVRGMRR